MLENIPIIRLPYSGNDTIKIVALSDVHIGNRNCDLKRLKSDLSKIDELTYIIDMGDLLDSIIVKDAKRYQKSSDDTKGDAVLDEQIETAYDILKPYKEKIIGLTLGNHELAILKYCSTDPTRRLATLLSTIEHKVLYLGMSWLMQIVLVHKSGGHSRTVVFRGHHGWGGGSRTQGADLTRYSRDVAYYSADVFLYGHVHRLQSDTIPRLGIFGNRLISKPKQMAICGTYLKTMSSSEVPTYSEAGGYPPVEVGCATIEIKPINDWVKIDIKT